MTVGSGASEGQNMQGQQDKASDVVLIGGGHSHALVMLALLHQPLPDVSVTVINPQPTAPYSGMLPGVIAGHYPRAALEIDLADLAARAGIRFVQGYVQHLDRSARLMSGAGFDPIGYDLVSLDVGIISDLPNLPGFGAHAVPAKPLAAYAARWDDWLARLGQGQVSPDIAVLGAGVAGAELAMAMAFRLHGRPARISLIDQGRALPNIGRFARRRLRAHLARLGIRLIEQAQPVAVGPDHVALADGRRIAASLVVGAGGTRPHAWLAETGLQLSEGFVSVDAHLRSVNDSAVFAVGDCAHMTHAPRPKAGVYAVRQAPFLLANLRAALGMGAFQPYQPQRDYLKLVSLGDRIALADKWGLPLEGRWLWRLKDRIDARFMAQFRG